MKHASISEDYRKGIMTITHLKTRVVYRVLHIDEKQPLVNPLEVVSSSARAIEEEDDLSEYLQQIMLDSDDE